MALSVNSYNSRLEVLDAEVTKLKNNIIAQQGFQFWEEE